MTGVIISLEFLHFMNLKRNHKVVHICRCLVSVLRSRYWGRHATPLPTREERCVTTLITFSFNLSLVISCVVFFLAEAGEPQTQRIKLIALLLNFWESTCIVFLLLESHARSPPSLFKQTTGKVWFICIFSLADSKWRYSCGWRQWYFTTDCFSFRRSR